MGAVEVTYGKQFDVAVDFGVEALVIQSLGGFVQMPTLLDAQAQLDSRVVDEIGLDAESIEFILFSVSGSNSKFINFNSKYKKP